MNDSYENGNGKEPNPATLKSTIGKMMNGKWRLYVGKQTAHPADILEWDAKNSELVFAFPSDIEEYLEFENEDIHTEYQNQIEWELDRSPIFKKVEEGKTLRATVKEGCLENQENQEKKEIEYEIYVRVDMKLVEADSPPVLLIQRPYRR